MATFTPTVTESLARDRYGLAQPSSGNRSPTRTLGPDSQSPSLQVLSPRQNVSCVPISEAEVSALPGWKVIADQATSRWGADWDRTVTSPPEYPDYPASACVGGDAPTVALNGEPFCSHSISEVSKADGHDGPVSIMLGTRSVAHLVVNRSAAFPSSLFLASPLKMPALSADLHDLPAVFTIDNVPSSTAIVRNEDIAPTNMSVPAGCSMRLTNTMCTAKGTARVRIEARGWVWFNYPERRDGHYKWAVPLETALQDVEQRASYVNLDVELVSSGVTAQAQQGCASATVPDKPTDPATPTASASRNQGLPTYALVLIVLFAGLAVLLLGYLIWHRVRQGLRRRTRGAARSRDLVALAVPVQARAAHPMPPPEGEKYRAWLAQLNRTGKREHVPPF